MTDRHVGYIVTLDKDIRGDDAEAIINALGMIRGVIAIEPIKLDVVGQASQRVVISRARSRLISHLMDLDLSKD